MIRLICAILMLIPAIAFAETSLTIQTNQEVELTECAENWPYDFDCVALNDNIQCLQPPGSGTEDFNGFPECTPTKVQTGIKFTDQKPGKVYNVKAGSNIFKFTGQTSSFKPRRIKSNGLSILIIPNE